MGILSEAEAEVALREELTALRKYVDQGTEDHGPDRAAATCVKLCTLFPQLPPDTGNITADLLLTLPLLMDLVKSCAYATLRYNACAALNGALVTDLTCCQMALDAGLTAEAVGLLCKAEDVVLRRNLIVLLGALAESSYEGLHDFLAAGAMAAVLAAGNADPELAQDVADTMCKVASDPDSRKELRDLGCVPFLAGCLGDEDAETQVRALMALAMLVEGDEDAQAELVRAPGSVPALFGIVREAGADSDCKAVASGLVAELSKSSGLKEAMLAQLREAMQRQVAAA
eukprot:jgi/Tetstr1/428344/TSEL_018379.t1